MTLPSLLIDVRAQLASPGVGTAQVQKIAAGVYRKIKQWPVPERNRLCHQLWKSGTNAEGNLAIYLYRHFGKQCAWCEFHLFEKWIDRYVHHWGHCDGVSHYLISASIANDPALGPLVLPWTESPNRWKRRAAAVSLVHEAGAGRNTVLILQVADRLLFDEDDLVRKAVGWLLKEAYAKKPRPVIRFLQARKENAPRIVLRIAAEKMTPAERALVLS
jgi:3-methyladenine DNA glycosylase AlkD